MVGENSGLGKGKEGKVVADYTAYLNSLRHATVLGINPPVRDFAFFDFWAKPLGLLYLLQALRERGNRVFLLDCLQEAREKDLSWGRLRPRRQKIEKPLPYRDIPRNYYHFGLTEDEFTRALKGYPSPDLICLTSGMTYWYPGVSWCISLIRTVFPNIPILLGGIYPRLCPEHATSLGADMVQTVPCSLQGEYPAVDLYTSLGYAVTRSTLGCPMGCEYCASRILDPGFSLREINRVVEEISRQRELFSVKDVAFYDDALLAVKECHFYTLCERLRSTFPELRYHTPNGLHVRQIDATCAQILFDTNFQTLRLSLESADPQVQQCSSSKVALKEYRSAVAALREAGFLREQIETYVLVGLPEQSLESALHTLEFIERQGGKAKTAQFSPIPGTSSFEKAAEKVPEIRREPLLHNNSVFAPYFGKYLTPEELQQIKNRAKAP